MAQLQPEPEHPKPVKRSAPTPERLEWSSVPADQERLEWSPIPEHLMGSADQEPEEAVSGLDEREAVGDDDLFEKHRRERHTAAFGGCVLGGATSLMSQLLAAGGDEELLIQGAGVWLAREHPDDPLPMLQSKPVVYCHPSLVDAVEGRLVLARNHRRLINYLSFITGGEEPPTDLVAIGTEAAIEDWAPGRPIHGSRPGVLGAPCTFKGVAGILTAGHVTDGHATVTYGSSPASVRLEYHAGTSTTPLAVGPDFAVIELPLGQGGGTALTPRTTRVGPSEPLTLLGKGSAGDVLAFAKFLRVQSRSGCWGDVYQLDLSIGGPGDSGTPVIDSTGLLAGHYLGRLGHMAVVQDVSYQVAELAKLGTTIP